MPPVILCMSARQEIHAILIVISNGALASQLHVATVAIPEQFAYQNLLTDLSAATLVAICSTILSFSSSSISCVCMELMLLLVTEGSGDYKEITRDYWGVVSKPYLCTYARMGLVKMY